VLVAADSGNGVSAALDWQRYLFINVDLSVHLHRMPEGEWVCLDAVTYPEPDGIGMADTRLLDERGPIGRSLQTVLVADRTPVQVQQNSSRGQPGGYGPPPILPTSSQRGGRWDAVRDGRRPKEGRMKGKLRAVSLAAAGALALLLAAFAGTAVAKDRN